MDVIVVSDDIAWCQGHLKLRRPRGATGNFTVRFSDFKNTKARRAWARINWPPLTSACRHSCERETPAVRALLAPYPRQLDFALLATAPRLIISNSTYSWWAAWLRAAFGSAEGRRIVMPWPFFNPLGKMAGGNDPAAFRGSDDWMVLNATTGERATF